MKCAKKSKEFMEEKTLLSKELRENALMDGKANGRVAGIIVILG